MVGQVGTPGAPRRDIVHAEALAWLDANEAEAGTSVVTSLPDVSEFPGRNIDVWRAWFSGAARRLVRWVPTDGVAIFFQSDIRQQGTWIDKGYLVMRAAEDEGASLLWHRIVCRKSAGTRSLGRASYSHMLCVAKGPRPSPKNPVADVLPDAGFMPWSKAMGENACRAACEYLRDETATRIVVDPFCGRGSVLAMANAFGFDAVGVDLNERRCKDARAQRGSIEISERTELARKQRW